MFLRQEIINNYQIPRMIQHMRQLLTPQKFAFQILWTYRILYKYVVSSRVVK